jgi:polar amino acid transport system permease protein/polar amino acid transport system substrate-binding protein
MWYIVLPQAFKNVLPSLANEFIVLLKETAVAGFVGVTDLMRGGTIIIGVTYNAVIPLLTVAAIYLILTMFFSWLVSKLERRLRSSDR